MRRFAMSSIAALLISACGGNAQQTSTTGTGGCVGFSTTGSGGVNTECAQFQTTMVGDCYVVNPSPVFATCDPTTGIRIVVEGDSIGICAPKGYNFPFQQPQAALTTVSLGVFEAADLQTDGEVCAYFSISQSFQGCGMEWTPWLQFYSSQPYCGPTVTQNPLSVTITSAPSGCGCADGGADGG